MYLRIDKGSMMYAELFTILHDERQRLESFDKWQRENLPEFGGEVLKQRSPWYIFADTVAWKFTGEVDTKTWQEVKGFPGYYETKRRTKAGKAMQERINEARGKRFYRMEFFDLFKTSTPFYGREFTVPNGFIGADDCIYMVFDDGNYKDITEKMCGQFTEITRGDWEKAASEYNVSTSKD